MCAKGVACRAQTHHLRTRGISEGVSWHFCSAKSGDSHLGGAGRRSGERVGCSGAPLRSAPAWSEHVARWRQPWRSWRLRRRRSAQPATAPGRAHRSSSVHLSHSLDFNPCSGNGSGLCERVCVVFAHRMNTEVCRHLPLMCGGIISRLMPPQTISQLPS